jgi:hypothetical protein
MRRTRRQPNRVAEPGAAERSVAERFVRETLGCGCAEEVFRHLETSRNLRVADVPVAWRIDVGRRLLVYVLEGEGPADLDRPLATLTRLGRVERDSAGYNRLRVVVATDDPAKLAERAREVLEGTGAVDDRVHLHVLPRAAVPPACA